jgi:hypothetical protein
MNEPLFSTNGRPAQGPSPATGDAIRAMIASDIAPVRSLSLRERAIRIGVAAFCAALVVAPLPSAPKIRPTAGPAIVVGVVAVLTATAGIVASFTPIGERRLGARSKLLIAVALFTCWLIYVVSIAHTVTAASLVERKAIMCGVRSFIAGLILEAIAFRVFRHSDPWAPQYTGALIGVAAGCVTAAGVGVGCSSSDLGHLLVGHALGLPVLALIGVLAARRRLQP